jgi:hypothetical protein
MSRLGSDVELEKYKGILRLAKAVIERALVDAADGSKEAVDFIDSYHFDLWCNLANLDAEYLRERSKRILEKPNVKS